MNTKQKFNQWASITFIVALASLAFTGLVLAEHEIPFVVNATYSWANFRQYNTALDQHTADQAASRSLINWARLEEYDRAFTKHTANQTVNGRVGNWARLEEYNRAFAKLGR